MSIRAPSENDEEVENENKIPAVKGEKTIKCWNCDTILMAKEEWTVVQCPTCEKICRIPGKEMTDIRNRMAFNSDINHFDINMPYVYIVVVCPFCRAENKVRTESEHVVCYKCHHSVNVVKQNGSVSLNQETTQEYVNKSGNGGYQSNNSLNYSSPQYPMRKAVKFSDLFFPDPMYFSGYYPSFASFSPLYPPYDPFMMDAYLYRKAKYDLVSTKLNKLPSSGREPVLSQLKYIQDSLSTIMNNKKYPYTPQRDKSGLNEDKVNSMKENMINNRKQKNEAVYKSIFGDNK